MSEETVEEEVRREWMQYLDSPNGKLSRALVEAGVITEHQSLRLFVGGYSSGYRRCRLTVFPEPETA